MIRMNFGVIRLVATEHLGTTFHSWSQFRLTSVVITLIDSLNLNKLLHLAFVQIRKVDL